MLRLQSLVAFEFETTLRPPLMIAFFTTIGLGATPNAVANMEAITERFGLAPRAFLVVPRVRAFFIDFTNALIITFFINLVA